MSVPNLWYGLAEERDPTSALAIRRCDQRVPIFVRVPQDPKMAKGLRRADYHLSVRWPEFYVRSPPKRVGLDLNLRLYLAQRDGGAWCVYCGDTMALEDLSIDHVIPESRGGTSNVINLVLACNPCNNDKDNRTPEEWRAGVILRRKHCRTAEERAAYDASRPLLPIVKPS